MILRTFVDQDDGYNYGAGDDLQSVGIIDHRRHIFLFVDPNQFNAKLVRSARAVILNECAYRGDGVGTINRPSIPNSVLIKASVYFCTVAFEEYNNPKTAQYTVHTAYSKERQSMFHDTERRTITYSPGHFSNCMYSADPEVIDQLVNSIETTILPPKYFTEKHMLRVTGDFNPIYCDMMATTCYGYELYDTSTRVEFLDVNVWDTMRLDFLNKLVHMEETAQDTFSISGSIFAGFQNFLGEGTTFIYDSDARGMNQGGSNIKGGKLPMGKFYHANYLLENIDTARILFEQSCHDLERQYGHLRVLCAPGSVGNKMFIRFKDYNKSPIESLGGETASGGQNTMDNGYIVDRMVEETISCCSGDTTPYAMYPTE